MTTRDIATLAGVSERTVYRHFPDRRALLDGLSQRLPPISDKPSFGAGGLDDLAATSRRLMELLDEHYVSARAEAVLNADPRHFAADTQANTRDIRDLLAAGLPDLDEREQLRIAAVIRCLVSTQAWLAYPRGVRGARYRVGPGGGLGDRHHHPRTPRRQHPHPPLTPGPTAAPQHPVCVAFRMTRPRRSATQTWDLARGEGCGWSVVGPRTPAACSAAMRSAS